MQRLFLTSTFIIVLCATPYAYAGDGSLIGAGVGGAVGGLFGSQFGRGGGNFVATGIGVGAGAVVGATVGQSVDNANRGSNATRPSFSSYDDTYAPVFASYSPNYVAPPAPPPIYVDAGTYCRAFSQPIVVDGQRQENYGTACLQPDGTWRVVP